MISDDDIEKALDYMRDSAKDCAKWRAEKVYLTEFRKCIKADLMKQSNEPSAVSREQYAYSHEDYKRHLESMKHAVYLDEKHRALVSAAGAKIDAWRSQQANQRTMGKIV